MSKIPSHSIGVHLATLNLFREADGSLQITVAEANGAMHEWNSGKAAKDLSLPVNARPIDYIEELVLDAAENMKTRRS
jgi:hypothetical protein